MVEEAGFSPEEEQQQPRLSPEKREGFVELREEGKAGEIPSDFLELAHKFELLMEGVATDPESKIPLKVVGDYAIHLDPARSFSKRFPKRYENILFASAEMTDMLSKYPYLRPVDIARKMVVSTKEHAAQMAEHNLKVTTMRMFEPNRSLLGRWRRRPAINRMLIIDQRIPGRQGALRGPVYNRIIFGFSQAGEGGKDYLEAFRDNLKERQLQLEVKHTSAEVREHLQQNHPQK